MVGIQEFREAQRAEGPATIMSIGILHHLIVFFKLTIQTTTFVLQKAYMTDLKEKFTRMCDKPMVKKRYMYLSEEFLKEKPNFCAFMTPSLDERQAILVAEVPKLGEEAATHAIKEWGQPKSMITHLVFCTTSGVDMPGADYQLLKLLGLHPSVKRFMMFQQGCFGGGMALRLVGREQQGGTCPGCLLRNRCYNFAWDK